MKSLKELVIESKLIEAKKKEMIQVKLKKGKKIGHEITSPGKDGKPGKVLKRKGWPGKKDVGEASMGPKDNLKDIKRKFRKDWDAVQRGKVDIGDKKVEDFYTALFNYFADTGEMPYGTMKARDGDPYEWIHDRLMDESVSFDLVEELAYLHSKDGKQTFVVAPRNTKGMRGAQDKFSMYIVDTKTGKKIEDLGSHVSLKGAIKFGLNRGFVKQRGSVKTIKYHQSHDELSKAARYDTLTGKKRWGEEIEEGGMGGQPTGWERSASKKAAKDYKKLMAKHTKTRVFDIPFAEFREIETAANKVMGVRPGGKLTPGSLVRDLEKFTHESVVVGMDEAAPKASKAMELKSVKREYEKLMKKWGSTPITKIPFKDFEKIRELGDKLMGTPKDAGAKVGDLLNYMKELYAPGNISRNRNPDFDERQAMFNSNYKRIHKKNPSKDEMRAAGVGKGGDNPKGVKAWKAAMAALKASEGRK